VLFPVKTLSSVWKINPIGVLHVGAHNAEESEDYRTFQWGKVIWVEAQQDLINSIRKKLDPAMNTAIHATVWSQSGIEMVFNVASNTQSSSLLNFGSHEADYPDITVTNSHKVITETLESVIPPDAKFDFINLDIQGVELQALKGLGKYFDQINWIYTEVNKEEVYKDCSKVKDIDEYLEGKGFKRIATRWIRGQGWGDALYVRKSIKISLWTRTKSTKAKIDWIVSKLPSIPNMIRRFTSNFARNTN
jgi:FkbM family methyltransferase